MKKQIVIISVMGGVAEVSSSPRNIKVIIKDYDNCPSCGGIQCNAGWTKPCPSIKEK
jgi:hypothetical protein